MPGHRRALPAAPVWALAVLAGFLQVGGSTGAARFHGGSIDPWGYALLLVGPVAIVALARWRFAALGVAIIAAVVYAALGQPVGPIFGAPIAALLVEVIRSRRERWAAARREAGLARDREAARERVAIARDLHDVIGHSLSLINVQAGVALHLLDEQPDHARPALQTIKSVSHDALEEVRVVLDTLRDPGSATRSPAPTLLDVPALVEQTEQGPVAWTLAVTGSRGAVTSAVDTAAYRVVMEAMTNVRRHSSATRARIEIAYDEGGVGVRVTDNGRPEARRPDDPGAAIGLGLVGMRERVAALGGRLDAGPRPTGFTVEARFPRSTDQTTSEAP
ncbi:sensor histidine kinase [Segeticoccus rhizosphaerae]|jgi:signal transduction histidine kinase|uniref:sensor histidine kinase n=2 Tax=Segeticoccus rhizosphaerae TaxID=1104777 RepID=UPI0010C04994|nr:histidine kinase [Ornithinicoccus soli]